MLRRLLQAACVFALAALGYALIVAGLWLGHRV